MTPSNPIDFFPILIQFGVAAAFVIFVIVATHLLGPKKHSKVKDDTFECGIEVIGNARQPFNVKYFLTAILFVLFDVEVIFMYPWAVNFRDNLSNGTWLWEMVLFVVFLMLGFLYIIKKGALDWEK